jgi:superfamily I DNA/RNA helicase
LLALMKKMKANDLSDLLLKLAEYKGNEVMKLLNADKGTQAQSLCDKVDTIVALADGCKLIEEVEMRITDIFKDDNEGVVFSSVHRAKGLEAKRVYILKPELMPHPMAKQGWELQQEQNIIYVAYTRSLNELVFVGG